MPSLSAGIHFGPWAVQTGMSGVPPPVPLIGIGTAARTTLRANRAAVMTAMMARARMPPNKPGSEVRAVSFTRPRHPRGVRHHAGHRCDGDVPLSQFLAIAPTARAQAQAIPE